MVKTCPPNQENCDKILSKLSSIENRLNVIENETPSNETINEPNNSLDLDTYKKCQQAYYSQENNKENVQCSMFETFYDDDDEE